LAVSPPPLTIRGREFLWGSRTYVMGVLNITLDSFSGDGLGYDVDAAVAQGRRFAEEGADILDIGGESTRPGSAGLSADEELRRILPVLEKLAGFYPLPISVDTSKAEVAHAALERGAAIVNDVTALRNDPRVGREAARAGAAVVLMHMRGDPATMQAETAYADVVAEVHAFLRGRAAAARAAGIPAHRVFLDPGIGFGKDLDGNLALLQALPDLAALGHPVVLGASRKSFIGRLTGAAVDDRLPGSLAALAATARLPRVLVRVHDVADTVQFLTVAAALEGAA
jgi:dihydropteroate synthase